MSVLVLVALLLGATQAPLPYAVGTATIRGHIVRTDGPPLARAEVRLATTEKAGPPRTATTDESGAYEFTALPAGRYTLTAMKTGYVSLQFGQRRAFEAGQAILLKAGETRERVDVALPRHGAVTGRIVDENGEPLEGVSVSVTEIRSVGGRRRIAAVPGVQARQTNELGRFRVYGLPPGDYAVRAEVGQAGSDDLRGFPVTYFPGTTNSAEAQRIRIGLADEVSNVDFALAPVRTARITGRTFTSSGEPFEGGVQMRPTWRSTGTVAEAVGGRPLPDGAFEFPNVPPGEYVIQAFKGTEIGWQIVAVNGADVTDLAVKTMPGSTITGRVTFEGGDAPKPDQVELVTSPADPDLMSFFGTSSSADVHEDGTFEIEHVTGPSRLRVARAPSGWALQRVIVGGIDATDAALSFGAESESLKDVEVVLTNALTRMTGRVTDGRGTPAADGAVIVFSDDDERWYEGSRYVATSRPGRDGSFEISGLPPGRYFAIAVHRLPESDAWRDRVFLKTLAATATRVTLTDGQQLAIDVNIVER
jgi:hypothetical protein